MITRLFTAALLALAPLSAALASTSGVVNAFVSHADDVPAYSFSEEGFGGGVHLLAIPPLPEPRDPCLVSQIYAMQTAARGCMPN